MVGVLANVWDDGAFDFAIELSYNTRLFQANFVFGFIETGGVRVTQTFQVGTMLGSFRLPSAAATAPLAQ